MAGGDSVQQIKERLSIVDVVSSYVELHQAGKNLKGKSPFTNEKTPSFYVSPDRGMYYCFSSSQGGDIFTFVQSMEGVDFKGALKILAEKAGVELVPEDPMKRTERETGFAVLESATSFFEEKRRGAPAIDAYLKNRGVNNETIAKWRIGYAPGPPDGGWRELRTHLLEKNHTDDQLLKTGLIKRADEGKEPYDVFRDRVMFPLFDASGKVIAFSGRIFSKDSEAPKYVNSPETTYFNKSEVLYGYDKAKQGIRQYDFSLIVEGQFDVVLCHQAGYTNTVAVSGTALTEHHVALLQRLSSRVVLALDADRAGVSAVKRSADVMLSRGIDVKVARVPEGSDPADIIKENPKQFKEIIGHATHVIEFLLGVLKEQARDERSFKLTARTEVLPYILKMQNKIDAEHFEGVVATAIGTTKEAVHLEVARLAEEERNKPKVTARSQETPLETTVADSKHTYSRRVGLQRYLVEAVHVVSPAQKPILQENLERITGEAYTALEERTPPEEKSALMFTLETELADAPQKQFIEDIALKLKEFELLTILEKISIKREQLHLAEQEGDSETAEKLLSETSTLQQILSEANTTKDWFAVEELEK